MIQPKRVPVVSLVGRSGVGKTTALEPIIRELNLTDDDLWLPRGASG